MRRSFILVAVLGSIGCGSPIPPCVADANIFPCVAMCHNGVQDGDETDVDCGGHCPGCEAGHRCLSEVDCSSFVCVNQMCAEATCSDGVENGHETDKDCGRHANPDGGTLLNAMCDRCAPGKHCLEGDDCQSGICAMILCTPSLCSDGMKDGSETDVDCGGPYCPACGAGKRCFVGMDCKSTTCFNNTCR